MQAVFLWGSVVGTPREATAVRTTRCFYEAFMKKMYYPLEYCALYRSQVHGVC